jgi:hypothetical protein
MKRSPRLLREQRLIIALFRRVCVDRLALHPRINREALERVGRFGWLVRAAPCGGGAVTSAASETSIPLIGPCRKERIVDFRSKRCSAGRKPSPWYLLTCRLKPVPVDQPVFAACKAHS